MQLPSILLEPHSEPLLRNYTTKLGTTRVRFVSMQAVYRVDQCEKLLSQMTQ